MAPIKEIRSALENLRRAINDTAENINEKSKKGLLLEDSDFDLAKEARSVIDKNAEDWLWQLLQEIESLHEFLNRADKEFLEGISNE